MSRTKGGVKTHKRHRRVLKQARGYYGLRSRAFTVARETLDRALAYAFAGRKLKKRDYRSLWIARISGALHSEAFAAQNLSYSRFISALKSLEIEIDRKVLADLAFHQTKAFAELVAVASKVESQRVQAQRAAVAAERSARATTHRTVGTEAA